MKKTTLVIGAVVTATALVGGWALAQTVGPGSHGFGPRFMHGQGLERMGPGMTHHMGKGMGPGMMKGHGMGPGMKHGAPGSTLADPARIEALKTELGITATQELAWTAYASAVREAAAAMKATREAVDPDAVSRMTSSDRFAFVSSRREQAQKQFEAVRTAANELLATLDDSQRAKAADIPPGLAFGPGTTLGAGMGGPQHRH